jgi:hypothetical protein
MQNGTGLVGEYWWGIEGHCSWSLMYPLNLELVR